MFNVNFSGTVNVSLPWSSSTITTAGGSPPPANFNDLQSVATVSPDILPINWTGNVPSSLLGQSVSTIFSSPSFSNFQISRSLLLTVTSGIQQSEDFGKPLLHLYFQYDNGTIDNGFDIDSLEWNSAPCQTGFGPRESGYLYPLNNVNPTGTLNLPLITSTTTVSSPFSRLTALQVIPWNECNQCTTVNFDCENRDVNNFTMTAVMTVTISFSCEGANLENGFCLQYCSDAANQESCKDNYINFCLLEKNSNNEINIFSSAGCQDFFEDYIANSGPKSEIDNPLNVACQLKFPGFDSFAASGDPNLQKVCACHLADSLYANLKASIIKDFPGFAFVAENQNCLFLPCASTVFTTVNIGKRCALPGCINIASITNNGDIKGNTKIIQSDQCIDASNQTGNNSGVGGNILSWWDKHLIWVLLGVGILIVLIIVILIIIASESGKKKHIIVRN